MKRQFWGIVVVVLLTWLRLPAPGQVQTMPEIVRQGKLATALVEVSGGKAYGSAFCIRASGLFVTNAHVVEAAGDGSSCFLILHPGEKDQKKVAARVRRINREADLALLQIESKAPLSALELGDSDNLVETQETVVFGFPFGTDLSVANGEYPGITVTTGHITALRKTAGVMAAVQMDAAVHPGNSGGPVLDTHGKVIGIVVARFLKAEGINFAIPVNQLRTLLSKTEIVFTPPSIPPARRHEKQDFVIEVTTFASSSAPYQVELSLTTGKGTARTAVAQSTDKHTFHVAAVPVEGTDAAAPLHLTFQDSKNDLECQVADRAITVAGKPLRLSQIREIRLHPAPTVILTDGTTLEGPIGGLGEAETEVAGNKIALHLNRADRIRMENNTAAAPTVAYHIVVRQQKQVVAESSGDLPLAENGSSPAVPAATAFHPNSAPLRFAEAQTYMVPAAGDAVMAADMDGDRNLDVVIGGDKEIGVLYGKRDGTLEPYVMLLTWAAGIGSRQLVDMNGDGRPDLVFLDRLGKMVILYNKGSRKFAEPTFQSIEHGSMLHIADLNRDGRPDIVVNASGDGGAPTIKVLLNNGDGTFHEQYAFHHYGLVEGFATRDINGDGIPDLAVSFETSTVDRSGVSIYYGDGKGNFRDGPTYNLGTQNMTCPTFTDVNGDGKPDLMVCNYWGGNVAVLLNKGDGTFLAPNRYPAPAYPIITSVADFNQDGRLDFVVAYAGTSKVGVYRNRGDGTFEDPLLLTVGGEDCRSVFVADFNRDGKPDLVTQNKENGTISILINRTGER